MAVQTWKYRGRERRLRFTAGAVVRVQQRTGRDLFTGVFALAQARKRGADTRELMEQLGEHLGFQNTVACLYEGGLTADERAEISIDQLAEELTPGDVLQAFPLVVTELFASLEPPGGSLKPAQATEGDDDPKGPGPSATSST
jgi:hypothetical protein